ncbi:hypothetical protein VCO01S_10800 [Vibrio comitans NBRC 102076]|uniref:Uncharacterized protein n=1 Tax=Vibrio comitans NBRC 102076 TaxID=1219078 RepID=A0A4Y3IKL4_9VIBR|nr:hypothetical protein VCO01S_10800 [Vibrio comitans NBRC 102076]
MLFKAPTTHRRLTKGNDAFDRFGVMMFNIITNDTSNGTTGGVTGDHKTTSELKVWLYDG